MAMFSSTLPSTKDPISSPKLLSPEAQANDRRLSVRGTVLLSESMHRLSLTQVERHHSRESSVSMQGATTPGATTGVGYHNGNDLHGEFTSRGEKKNRSTFQQIKDFVLQAFVKIEKYICEFCENCDVNSQAKCMCNHFSDYIMLFTP